MEKLILLVPKIWQEESCLLLEISFLLAEKKSSLAERRFVFGWKVLVFRRKQAGKW